MRRIVEAETDGVVSVVGQIRDDRVVCVDDERRVGGQRTDGRAPTFGDELELAVAVELVAEEVSECHDARTKPRHRLRKRALVDLEQTEVGIRGRRRAQRRSRRAGSRPRGSTRAGARRRGSRPPWPSWSSCRWSPTSPRRRRRSRAASRSTAVRIQLPERPFPGSSFRRRDARRGRARRARARPTSRVRAGRPSRASVPRRGGGGCSGELAECAERSKLLAEMARPRSRKRASGADRRGRARGLSRWHAPALHGRRDPRRAPFRCRAHWGDRRRCESSHRTRRLVSIRRPSSSTSGRGTRPSGQRACSRDAFSRGRSSSSSCATLGEDLGRTPTARDLAARGRSIPSASLYAHTFGSLGNALREAGFEVLQGEERLDRAVEQGARLAVAARPPAQDGRLGGGSACRSLAPVGVAGVPPARRSRAVPGPRSSSSFASAARRRGRGPPRRLARRD